jgi:uncharacterized protein YccT (UPF0319 family)
MLPGLWHMNIQGQTHAPPDLTVPVQREMDICVKPGQEPQTVVIPASGKECTSTHETLADGQTQWTFHCELPGAKVTQTGTFATAATTFDSHWTIDSTADSGKQTQTTLQVTGKRLGRDCGKAR